LKLSLEIEIEATDVEYLEPFLPIISTGYPSLNKAIVVNFPVKPSPIIPIF